ncbi:MAG TPA: DinB family protein [Pseudonocardiaceae bacterium]|nr:DinB family protein [Pseudonocardiaceae bacterium]
MDHCAQCGFTYEDLGVGEIPGALRQLGTGFRSRLEPGIQDTERENLLRRRPEPEVWSALEYSCHVRDVLLIQRERLYLALVEDNPQFSPMHRDQRVILGRYNDDSAEDVSREVGLAASLLARAFATFDAAQWDRRCVYPYPTPAQRTLAWLARHSVHEGRHHLQDVDRVLCMVAASADG